MANFAYNTQGSTPTSPFASSFSINGSGNVAPPTTPAAKALNTAAQPPAPSTPVKKTTVNNVDGSSHVTEYHAPAPAQPTSGLLDSPAQPKPQPATFPGLINSLSQNSQAGSPIAGVAANQLANTPAGTPAAQGYTSQAAQYGAGSIPVAAEANDIAQQFGQRYADVGKQGARFEAGQLTTGTSPVAEGNAAVTAQTTAAQQQALAQGEQAALQGIGYQLTGQQQAANAALGAAGAANTSQSNQITGLTSAGALGIQGQGQLQSGLTSAAGLAQPQAYGLTSQPYNPLSDTYGGGGTGGVLDRAKLAGQVAGTQAAAAAPGQAQASNIQTGGTAPVQANQAIYTKALGDYKNLENSISNVDQFGQLLVSSMIDKNTGQSINPTDARYANRTIAQIRGQLSNAQQATFDTTLAALTSKVSGLLSVGGNEIPTDISAAANKIIDGSLPVSALASVLNRIGQEGNILLKNQANIVNSSLQGLQGGQQSQPDASNSGSLYHW